MKQINTFVIVLLFTMPFFLNAQSGKPIYEILGLQEGCPLPVPSKPRGKSDAGKAPEYAVEMEIDVPPPPPPPPPPPSNNQQTEIVDIPEPPSETSMLKDLKSFLKSKKYGQPEMKFGENKFVLDEDMNWNLVSQKGKKISKTKFELVKISFDETNLSFTGKELGKAGFNVYNKNAEPFFKENFQRIRPYGRGNYVFFYSGKKIGVAHLKKGKILIPAKYDQVQHQNNCWIVQIGKLKGILDEKGKVILAPKYEELSTAYSEDGNNYCFIPARNGELDILKNGKTFHKLGIKYNQYGYGKIFHGRYLYYNHQFIDLKKKQFLACGDRIKVENHQSFHTLFSVTDKKGQNWFFNEKGEVITGAPVGNKASRLQIDNHLAAIGIKTDKKNPLGYPVYKVGLLDKQLEWRIEPKYTNLSAVKKSGLYLARNKEHQYGVIDTNEQVIIPFEYAHINNVGKVLLAFRVPKSSRAEVLDFSGKKLFEAELNYKHISTNSIAYEARRLSDGKRVMLNERFEVIYDQGFNNKGKFGKDAIWVDKFGNTTTYNAFDLDGNPYPVMVDGQARTDYKKIKHIYRTPFFLIQLSDDKKYLYNPNTKSTSPIKPDINYLGDALYKSHGLIAANKEYREDMGIIDSLGKEILPPVFKNVSQHENMISVQSEDRNYIFASDGEQLLEQYDNTYYLFGKYFWVKKKDKVGLVNIKGEIIIPLEYKSLSKSGNWDIQVTDFSGKKTIYNVDGEKIK